MPYSPHVRVPSQLAYDGRVSSTAVRLWMVLDDVCREQRSAEIETGSLASAIGLGLRQLRTLTQELVDAGWLHVTLGPGRHNSNRYSPLGRARTDLVGSVDDAVDPGREKRQNTAGFSRSKAAAECRFSSRGTSSLRARQEAQGQTSLDLGLEAGNGSASPSPIAAPPSKPGWCGGEFCDPESRLLGRLQGWDVVEKCPACHPSLASF